MLTDAGATPAISTIPPPFAKGGVVFTASLSRYNSCVLNYLFFPQRCVGCGAFFKNYLCESCYGKIIFNETQHCPHISCGKQAIGGLTHFACRTPYGLDGHISLTEYSGVVKSIIEYYKRRHVRRLEETFREIAQSYFTDGEEPFTTKGHDPLVTSVPLHWFDEKMKGFNPSEQLANIFADALESPSDFTVLKKIKPTHPQKDLKKAERLHNIRGVFQVSDPARVRGKSVIIIDDIWTTGATLRECAKVLKRAGAQNVWAITLARGI